VVWHFDTNGPGSFCTTFVCADRTNALFVQGTKLTALSAVVDTIEPNMCGSGLQLKILLPSGPVDLASGSVGGGVVTLPAQNGAGGESRRRGR
jgi:hypothetical protein